MTNVIFYILPEQNSESEQLYDPAHFSIVCDFIASNYRNYKKVQVITDGQQQAELIDEILWQMNDHFVPHNLKGEGPKYGTPVEIIWEQPKRKRSVLINLKNQPMSFYNLYNTIIDFVPSEESLKQLARERYKSYREIGFNICTEQL